jgi:hypothetical protein
MRTADAATDYKATVKAFQGCDAVIHLAAIPNPVDKEDHAVHSNNVNSAFNGFRACGELGIKKICYASSVNAIGLAYANQPLRFPYFPIDEDYPPNPTDSYALAKQEAEIQAKAFVNWFPGTKIALMRIHEVALKGEVRKEHEEKWEEAAVSECSSVFERSREDAMLTRSQTNFGAGCTQRPQHVRVCWLLRRQITLKVRRSSMSMRLILPRRRRPRSWLRSTFLTLRSVRVWRGTRRFGRRIRRGKC